MRPSNVTTIQNQGLSNNTSSSSILRVSDMNSGGRADALYIGAEGAKNHIRIDIGGHICVMIGLASLLWPSLPVYLETFVFMFWGRITIKTPAYAEVII